MEYNYSINLPYPELSGKISPNTMALLMESFGGKNSEFTSLTTYIYQHLMVGNKNSNLATLLSKISIVEMKHQELIGEAIVFFGGKPLYSGAYNFWNGSYANYQENVLKFLSDNILAEQNAIRLYEEIIEHTQNDSLKKLLGRIIMDEQLHLTIFETELNNLKS
ncbi:MAG: manganese catalase family protein [Clostridia bacterium]|nr:manganese catalase family protein [Clostridia bacterium]